MGIGYRLLRKGETKSDLHVRKSTVAVCSQRGWIGKGQARGLKTSQEVLG